MKLTKYLFIGYILIVTVLLSSCGEHSDKSSNSSRVKLKAKGGRVYGGKLAISSSEMINSFYPASVVDLTTANTARQIFEGLVSFSPKDLTIVPRIASSWEVSPDGKTYTFHLRDDVRFHDDECFPDGKGRLVTATDFKYSFELLCSQAANNAQFSSTFKDKVKGATAYFANSNKKTKKELTGVSVVDEHTLKIELLQPSTSFLYILAHQATVVVAKEAIDKYGDKIVNGTGPFVVSKEQHPTETNKLILQANPNYYRADSLGNILPFLDTVIIRIIDSKKGELDAFKRGEVDMVNGLPSNSIKEIVEQQIANFQNHPPAFILERQPEMGTNYYELNLAQEVFQNKKVRQALNYAIDRNKIIEEVLKREAYGPGEFGITPPSFKGYDVSKIKGYSFDVQKAKKLMTEAGYPNGGGFPTIKLELNSGGYKNTSVAFEVQKQLMDNLNINIDLEVVPFSQKIEDEKYGRADMFRTAWISDFPNPENFLFLFYGKGVPETTEEVSYPNVMRYKNDKFDDLFERALATSSLKESYDLMLQAEQIAMDDAPVIVLWYNESVKLIQSNVRNFYTNPMNYKDFSQVYFKALSTNITKRGQ